ncbi:DeoR/GlpR family DNA-binding transcription regulator [Lactobacillus sp. ESL0684]|uniref:DeoR/GlpR family DNA-binding transcription regulator n=1 Tax=Lactobacillus sp. ESL0684 TaxID=2983213 RepID=UPI0023F8B8A3|nr:DeoR/GlpR family DNA-binding transcription regulator [Lactobacillus sp. ESL0684]WEV43235.1 DeoR/GlpR family DNA-binding transcription regulator [Lactobacillus sp. ESL0684]
MKQEERLRAIKQLLTKKHQLETKDLAKYFNVSFDTARRDVLRLTSTGQAIRVHGGLLEISHDDVPNFLTRNQIDSPVKTQMAQMAKHFVHPNQCDFIGPSTTLKKLSQLINGMDLQVVTNSIDNSLELMRSNLPSVRLLGGKIDKQHRFSYSISALEILKRMNFNTAFIGTSNVKSDGLYLTKMSDAELIRIAAQRANQVVVIAEAYKFNNQNTSPYLSIPLDNIDVLITDTSLPTEIRQNFATNTQIIPVLKKRAN